MTITIVPARYDEERAQRLVAALGVDLDCRYGADALGQQPDPSEFAPPHGSFRLVAVDGATVACGGVRRMPYPVPAGVTTTDSGRIAELKRMFVADSHRGRGLSRLLLGALESFCVDAGYLELWLETGTAQPEARRLYASAGYEPIAPYGEYRDYPDSRCYAKVLPESGGATPSSRAPLS
ncbi:GNAT family N-acetyltransferase [soil metagenome]